MPFSQSGFLTTSTRSAPLKRASSSSARWPATTIAREQQERTSATTASITVTPRQGSRSFHAPMREEAPAAGTMQSSPVNAEDAVMSLIAPS